MFSAPTLLAALGDAHGEIGSPVMAAVLHERIAEALQAVKDSSRKSFAADASFEAALGPAFRTADAAATAVLAELALPAASSARPQLLGAAEQAGTAYAKAAGIAYRPVRNRGTIGGSLAHADPAADWVSALTAMGASVVLAGPAGRRTVPMDGFILGVFETDLQPGEVIAEVRVPAFSPAARWGYYKVCRKTGEFSHATGAVLLDPPRGVARAVIGAVSGPPLVIDDPAVFTDPARRDALAADRLAGSSIAGDPAAIRTHMVALARAIAQVVP